VKHQPGGEEDVQCLSRAKMDWGKKMTLDNAALTVLLPDGNVQHRLKSLEVAVGGSLAHAAQPGYFLYRQALRVLVEEMLHVEQTCRPVSFASSISLIQFSCHNSTNLKI